MGTGTKPADQMHMKSIKQALELEKPGRWLRLSRSVATDLRRR